MTSNEQIRQKYLRVFDIVAAEYLAFLAIFVVVFYTTAVAFVPVATRVVARIMQSSKMLKQERIAHRYRRGLWRVVYHALFVVAELISNVTW